MAYATPPSTTPLEPRADRGHVAVDMEPKVGSDTKPKRPAPNGGRGRPRGAVNKTTASIKGAFVEAFEKMGGATALVIWGTENPTEFYRLASKLIPTEVNATVAATLKRADELTDEELAARIK